MLTILTTTNNYLKVETYINSIERLNELVDISVDQVKNSSNKIIRVESDSIIPSLDWNDTEPPYVFPTVSFTEKNLLAIVFYKLGNHQKAFEFVTEQDELYQHLLIGANLQNGYTITNEQIHFLENTATHNLAVAYNFGIIDLEINKQTIQNAYEEAIKNAKTDSLKLFSIKHYVNLLLDNGLNADAEKLIRPVLQISVSEEEKNAMNHLLSVALMAQISLPYNTEKLSEIAYLQEHCVSYYEKNELKINAGLLLINVSEIANYQEDFEKSKFSINMAIEYFRDENIPDFLAEATFQKAILFYTWSKNGSPQYYKPAINTFQNALKVFKRDTHPQKFADIHHNLALIYSEIKVSTEEKPIWTAFCASSFKEALQFYTKDAFPYQFAMISHNYATALMGFPEAKLHNNLNKAFDMFEEVLTIRTTKKHPFERALTLLNQLELYWLIHNESSEDEVKNYDEMYAKANEIKILVSDKALLKKAEEQLDALNTLKSFIN